MHSPIYYQALFMRKLGFSLNQALYYLLKGKNKETPEQKAFLDFAESQGYIACVSNSWEDTRKKIDVYLKG